MPEGEEWIIIDNLIKILEPFQKITSDDNATTKAMKEVINKDLSNRYQTDTLKNVINVTAILDPRYKELPFLSGAESKEIFDYLEQLLIDMHLPHDSEDNLDERNEVQSTEFENPAKRPRNSEDEDKSKFSKLLRDIFETDTVPPRLALVDKVKWEMSLYKAEHVADLDSNPLKWWNDRKHTYPLITKLVQKMFSIVATSVPSEQLLSCSGNIISERRSCLLPENADKLIFLHKNITNQ